MDYSNFLNFLNEASQDRSTQVAENEADMERREEKFENVSDILAPIGLVASDIAVKKISSSLGLEEDETKNLLKKIAKGDTRDIVNDIKQRSLNKLQERINTSKQQLQSKLDNVNNQFNDITKNILTNDQRSQLNDLLEQRRNITNKLNELRENNAPQSDIDDLQSQLTSLVDKQTDILKSLNPDDLKTVTSLLDNKESIINNLQGKINISDDTLSNIASGNFGALKEQATKLAKIRLQQARDDVVKQAQQKFETARQQTLDTIQEQRNAILDKVEQGRNQVLDTINERKQQLENEFNSRRQDLADNIEKTKSDLKSKVDDIRNQARNVRDQADKRVKSLQDDTGNALDDIANKSSRIQDLQNEISNLTKQLPEQMNADASGLDQLSPMRALMGLGGEDDEEIPLTVSQRLSKLRPNADKALNDAKNSKQAQIDKLNKEIEDTKTRVSNNRQSIQDTLDDKQTKLDTLQNDLNETTKQVRNTQQITQQQQQNLEDQINQERITKQQEIENEVNNNQTQLEQSSQEQLVNLDKAQSGEIAKSPPTDVDESIVQKVAGKESKFEKFLKGGDAEELEEGAEASGFDPLGILGIGALVGGQMLISSLIKPKEKQKNNLIFSPSYQEGIGF
jgi:chromosome segregation ATPase